MKIVCAPKGHPFKNHADILNVVLYSAADRPTRGSAGAAVLDEIRSLKYVPAPRAWDFLSLALAVTSADLAGHRTGSPDGWTRQFDMEVAVGNSIFWIGQRALVNRMLGFLTTDLWRVGFSAGGACPAPPKQPSYPVEDCVALLSGGLDSFVGNLDLAAAGKRAFVVSQTVRGDAEKQRAFAGIIGGGLSHIQVNHNADVPKQESPPSQRARSLIFLAYGILIATTLKKYHEGKTIPLYVCENGFISINPPLTGMRLGSLSTRTTNPAFLLLVQQLLDAAGLRVKLNNPYQLKTKGEMLRECKDPKLLKAHATSTTSCGRFLQFSYTHCGRCVPCLVRRGAFHSASIADNTKYVYENLGRNDSEHSGLDDVRSVAMALAAVKADGLEAWTGTALSTTLLGDVSQLQAMLGRGLGELGALLKAYGVK